MQVLSWIMILHGGLVPGTSHVTLFFYCEFSLPLHTAGCHSVLPVCPVPATSRIHLCVPLSWGLSPSCSLSSRKKSYSSFWSQPSHHLLRPASISWCLLRAAHIHLPYCGKWSGLLMSRALVLCLPRQLSRHRPAAWPRYYFIAGNYRQGRSTWF